jgi:UDP-N-acetylglucosamine 4,6-dehydratase
MDTGVLKDSSVLVTGATGSFGRAFVRTLLGREEPGRVVVFSRDEMKQFEMQQDPTLGTDRRLRYFLGDVRDVERLDMAMRGIDYVVHAAALKQIPTAEYNPFECIHTNVLGAENVVRAAVRNSVKRVIALSTDKAANPINLYGASKLASDKIFIAANNLGAAVGTKFAVVRYGNVLGSRGSVIPFFRKLLQDGATSIPITDERMTRFWITLSQGVEFVVSSLRLIAGGETFVPKLPSMKVVDLAKAIAPGVPHRNVGIRPGEKLHEVMITEDDGRTTFDMGDRYVIQPAFPFWDRKRDRTQQGNKVGDSFRYSSDENDHWLTGEALLRLIATAPA